MNKEEKQYLIDQIYSFLAVVEKEFLQEEKADKFVDIFKEIYKSRIPFFIEVTSIGIEVELLDKKNENEALWRKMFSSNNYDEALSEFLKAILKYYPNTEIGTKLKSYLV